MVPLQKKKDDDEEDEAKQQVPRMYLTFKGRSSLLPGSLVVPRPIAVYTRESLDTRLATQITHALSQLNLSDSFEFGV